jgi:nucleotide-binding universal stress UspA family protein
MTAVHRILCPVDFSEPSRQGVSLARAVAAWFGARLTLIYVHQLVAEVIGVGPAVAMSPPTVLSEGERRSLADSLRSFAGGDQGIDHPSAGVVDSIVAEDVSVARAILDRAGEIQADLIVIGTQGRSRLERFGLGSVAETVLRKAECPVLAVPPDVPAGALSAPAGIRHVVCPIDFSPHAMNGLPRALQWAAKAGARVTALHVVEISPELDEPPLPEFEAYRDRVISDARRHLADTVREASPRGPVEQRLAVGRPAREILRFATDHQADLIVMGVRGRSPVDMAFFGSTTNRVVRRAPCPVLTVHAAQ